MRFTIKVHSPVTLPAVAGISRMSHTLRKTAYRADPSPILDLKKTKVVKIPLRNDDSMVYCQTPTMGWCRPHPTITQNRHTGAHNFYKVDCFDAGKWIDWLCLSKHVPLHSLICLPLPPGVCFQSHLKAPWVNSWAFRTRGQPRHSRHSCSPLR